MISWKIAILMLISMLGTNGNIYSTSMAVVEVEDDYITCVDFNGEEWAFENDGAEDWYEGDLVSCTMYDNNTDTIYDDEIISVKYSGWVAGAWGYDIDSESEIVYFNY